MSPKVNEWIHFHVNKTVGFHGPELQNKLMKLLGGSNVINNILLVNQSVLKGGEQSINLSISMKNKE
jgi:hypothetical protein